MKKPESAPVEEIVIEEEIIEEKVEELIEESIPEHSEEIPVKTIDLREDTPEPETQPSKQEIQEELAAEYPDGITEEQFKEGNRTITKRVVVKDGVGNEYRKVVHGWGGVFYFKNGDSISERAWNQETVLQD